jgi:hypothetical protein
VAPVKAVKDKAVGHSAVVAPVKAVKDKHSAAINNVTGLRRVPVCALTLEGSLLLCWLTVGKYPLMIHLN